MIIFYSSEMINSVFLLNYILKYVLVLTPKNQTHLKNIYMCILPQTKSATESISFIFMILQQDF